MNKKRRAFIFYGISGSGKGTQAKLLIEYLKKHDPEHEVIYIETGARIREFIEDNAGYTRDMVKDVLNHGGLLPEFVPVWLWSHLLVTRYTGKETLVIDGAARRPHESPILEGALRFYGFDTTTVVLLETSRAWAKERLQGRGRYDDDNDDIERRFSWYEKNTIPAANYFRDKEGFTFLEVSGEKTIEEVHEEIIKKLGFEKE